MPDSRLLYDANAMSAFHLQGKSHIVTIAKWIQGKLRKQGAGNKTEKKPVIYFQEKNLPLVVNKTNRAIIAGMYGNEIDNWIGKKIEIYPTTTKFGNELKDCIRVKPKIPTGKPTQADEPEPAPELTDEDKRAIELAEAAEARSES